jgi:glycosyltransferase involved in cell wall biosynthesis
LVVIDDGSTYKKTGTILNTISKQDSRIRIITQKNKGVSNACNAGLLIMKGDYFYFIDADDDYNI